MLFILLFIAAAFSNKVPSSLQLLVESVKHRRARSIPSIETMSASFDSLISTLDLPSKFVAATAVRTRLVYGANVIEARVKDLWTGLDNSVLKRPSDFKRETKGLKDAVHAMILLFRKALVLHGQTAADCEAFGFAARGVEWLNRLLDELPSLFERNRDPLDQMLPVLAKEADDEARNLRCLLTDLSDWELFHIAKSRIRPSGNKWVIGWWRFGFTVSMQWLSLSLRVTHLRLKSGTLVGLKECVWFAANTQTAIAVLGTLIQMGLYNKTSGSLEHVNAAWEAVRMEMNISNEASRRSIQLFYASDIAGFRVSLLEYRRSLLECFKSISSLRQLVGI